MERIEVSNCWDCPFKINDEIVGYNDCELHQDGFITGDWDIVLPKDKVHDLCPLKNSEYLFKLKDGNYL